MRSGFGSSARPKPGRFLRGRLRASAVPSDFCPFDGGSDELSGVLAGRSGFASRASSSAIRASAASNWPTSGSSERIRASFSATVSLLRSISGVTPTLNRIARDRVNHFVGQHPRHDHPGAAATRVSNYSLRQRRAGECA